MSTQNDLINYQNVIKEANSLINEQIKLWGGVVSSIQQVGKVTPSSFVNAQKQVNQALIKSTELTDKQRLADIRLQQAREKAFDRYEKQLQRETAAEQKRQALLARSENTYNKVQQKVNQLTQTYNNLATKKELGLNLTTKELAQLNSLESRLNKYNGVLKQVDVNIGKNNRNVGNYKSGFDGLGNSINQITRELPAFTYSAQTGIMALSNNIPILADEIQRVSQNVAKMRAEGKQVPGVMSQILTSFLSWQTALSIGVTLITVYGKEIGEFVKGLLASKKAIDYVKESKKALNSVTLEANKNAQKEIIELNNYIKVAKNASTSTENRRLAAKKLQDLYPQYFKDMSTDQIMSQDLTSIQRELTKALLDRAMAVASISKMTENASRILDLQAENELESEQLETLRKQAKIREQEATLIRNNPNARESSVAASGVRQRDVYSEIDKLAESRRKRMEEILNLEIQNAKFAEKAQKSTEDSFALDKPDNSKKTINTTKELIQSEYELAKVRLERQRADAKYAEDMETYFTKELELANLEYQYKKKLANLEIKDKERLAVELDKLQEEYTLRIQEIGRSEIANQEEVFKKLSDAIKKFYEFKQKAREEDEKKRQEGLKNEYELTQLQNEIDLESLGGNQGSKYWETKQKEIDDWYKYQQELHRNNAQELLKIDKEYELQNLQLLNDRKNAFKQAMTEMYSSALGDMGAGSLAQFFNGQFEEIWNGAETLQEKIATVMMAIGDIANDVFNAMSERQNAYFQQQFQNLETEKDLALQFAGENTAGREAIERQYDEKKRALQMEQAKREKRLAIAQATINIASAILSALTTQPVWLGIAMAALVGVLGAVQLATIASTPLPQFYKGTGNAPEGLALTQERGAEMITDKHGNIKTLGNNKGAQLTYLNKGDKVFTADETTQKLNELLISSGVSPIVNVSGGSGMSKEDMREVLNDTLAKQPKNSIIFDENGIKTFTSKENRRTILKNRNVRI